MQTTRPATPDILDVRLLEQRFRQRLLYALGGGVLVLMCLLIVSLVIVPGTPDISAALIAIIGCGFMAGVTLVLARLLYLSAAAYLLIYSSLVSLVPSIITGGATLAISVYLLGVMLLAGNMLNARGVMVAGIATCGVFAFSWASILNGWLPQLQQPIDTKNVAFTNGVLFGSMIVMACLQIYAFVRYKNAIIAAAQQQAQQLRAANVMLLAQQRVEQQIGQDIGRLATNLAALHGDQERVAQRQGELVSEVATSSQEMDQTTRTIAGNAQAVSDSATGAAQIVEKGQAAVAQGIGSFDTLRRRVEQITERVRTLSSQIGRISEVTAIIGDIADETNLLAINATIEAAGAREYGRRFAAVADEVQRLAGRAAQAVEEVQEMIAEVTEASRASLHATDEGLREVAQGAGQVEQMRVVNDQIEQGAVETAILARSIAQATLQQRQASEEIVATLLQLDTTTTQAAAANDEVRHVISDLRAAAHRLSAVTDTTPLNPRPASAPVAQEIMRI